MSAASLEPLLRALAAAFKTRGMLRHVDALRAYYAEHINKRPRRRATRSPASALAFIEPDVLEWARRLQVPPFEAAYVVQFKGAMCPRCHTPSAVGYIVEMWVDGAQRQCQFCKASWIERDPPAGSKSYSPRKDQR